MRLGPDEARLQDQAANVLTRASKELEGVAPEVIGLYVHTEPALTVTVFNVVCEPIRESAAHSSDETLSKCSRCEVCSVVALHDIKTHGSAFMEFQQVAHLCAVIDVKAGRY